MSDIGQRILLEAFIYITIGVVISYFINWKLNKEMIKHDIETMDRNIRHQKYGSIMASQPWMWPVKYK